MSTAIAVLAAIDGSDLIVALLVAVIVGAIVWFFFHMVAPAYEGIAAGLAFLVVLLLMLLENGTFD